MLLALPLAEALCVLHGVGHLPVMDLTITFGDAAPIFLGVLFWTAAFARDLSNPTSPFIYIPASPSILYSIPFPALSFLP
jgi:hypothetical protein